MRWGIGKSWFDKYLTILYGYQLFDGVLSVLHEELEGFCFDVCRANVSMFDYNVFEALTMG